MRRSIFLALMLSWGGASGAATIAMPFSCDQVKDKTVRASCIQFQADSSTEQQRLSRENAKLQQRIDERAKADEEAGAAFAQKQRESDALASYIKTATQRVALKLKDPDSARFTGLQLRTNKETGKRTLCGMVNAKNSYGGYTGAESFHVTEEPEYQAVYMAGEGSGSKDLNVLMAGIKALEKHTELCVKSSPNRDVKSLN